MGYYSEVALCLDAQAHKQFQEELTKQNETTQNEVAELLSWSTNTTKEDNVLFYWDSVKWYEDFPCVGFIMNFINNLSYDFMDNYLFLRVGENYEDIENQGYYWGNPFSVQMDRKIQYEQ